jgi:hypothetical protein
LDLSGIATMISAHTVREVWQLGSDLRRKAARRERPEKVYHYTDAAGLLGIVTDGTVWATHYEYLNDASEFKYAVGVMKSVIEKATTGAKPGSSKARIRDVMSKGNITSDDSADPKEAADRQEFVACFSEGGDELSQWRGYGKSIGGYSVGFPFAHLQDIEKRITDSQEYIAKSRPRVNVQFFPCVYDERQQETLIKEGFDRVLHHCDTTEYPVDDNSLAFLLKTILLSVLASFKDPAFRDEREWRLVVRLSRLRPDPKLVEFGEEREPTQDDIRKDKTATVLFRRGEYSLIPYIAVPVVLDAVLSLSEVILGPTPLPENALAAAMRLLHPEQRGAIAATAGQRIVCTNIINSKIPFRRV